MSTRTQAPIYPRNTWYVAGLSSEISRDITSRRLLGVDVALYRTLAGEPVVVVFVPEGMQLRWRVWRAGATQEAPAR